MNLILLMTAWAILCAASGYLAANGKIVLAIGCFIAAIFCIKPVVQVLMSVY